MTREEKQYLAKWQRKVAALEKKYTKLFRADLDAQVESLDWAAYQTPDDLKEGIRTGLSGQAVQRTQANLYTIDALPFARESFEYIDKVTKKADAALYEYQWTEAMSTYLTTEAGTYITSMLETSKDDGIRIVNKVTADAIRRGLSIGETMDLLEAMVPKNWRKLNVWRSELIARTEVITATNYADSIGVDSIADAEGLDVRKKWLVRLDGRERPWHGDMSRVGAIDRKAEFTVGGSKMQRPGDPNGGARNRCNCRCTLIWEVVEDGSDEG